MSEKNEMWIRCVSTSWAEANKSSSPKCQKAHSCEKWQTHWPNCCASLESNNVGIFHAFP